MYTVITIYKELPCVKLICLALAYNHNYNTIIGLIVPFIHIKLYSLKDTSKHQTFFPDKKKSVETSHNVKERKKILRSVLLFQTAPKVSRVYSGRRLILHPSVVVIHSIVFCVILLTNQPINGWKHNVLGGGKNCSKLVHTHHSYCCKAD